MNYHDVEVLLRSALWMTKEQRLGMPIKDVAKIIKDQFEKEEVESLVKELQTEEVIPF